MTNYTRSPIWETLPRCAEVKGFLKSRGLQTHWHPSTLERGRGSRGGPGSLAPESGQQPGAATQAAPHQDADLCLHQAGRCPSCPGLLPPGGPSLRDSGSPHWPQFLITNAQALVGSQGARLKHKSGSTPSPAPWSSPFVRPEALLQRVPGPSWILHTHSVWTYCEPRPALGTGEQGVTKMWDSAPKKLPA